MTSLQLTNDDGDEVINVLKMQGQMIIIDVFFFFWLKFSIDPLFFTNLLFGFYFSFRYVQASSTQMKLFVLIGRLEFSSLNQSSSQFIVIGYLGLCCLKLDLLRSLWSSGSLIKGWCFLSWSLVVDSGSIERKIDCRQVNRSIVKGYTILLQHC